MRARLSHSFGGEGRAVTRGGGWLGQTRLWVPRHLLEHRHLMLGAFYLTLTLGLIGQPLGLHTLHTAGQRTGQRTVQPQASFASTQCAASCCVCCVPCASPRSPWLPA